MENQLGEQDSYNTAVAKVLRRLYEQSGISYNELAYQTGIAKSTIIRAINGERQITAKYVHALAKEFGTTAGAIFLEADNS